MGEAAYGGAAAMRTVSKAWWLFLVTGMIWLWLSLIVFRAELETVYAISIMFGVIAIASGLGEFMSLGLVRGGWKWLHGALGVIFVVIGIVALANPEWTFLALASIIAWWFLFKGLFDLVVAFGLKATHDNWWVQMVVGFVELGLAFWVAGDFREQVILLVVYVGATCLVKGITDIVLAFRLRRVKKELVAA